MNISAVGSDDGRSTYEIHRKWAEKGKKALVIELYPTLTADKCGSMDVSTMHLMNHVQELGWSEVRIVNLYSKVFSEKPTVSPVSETTTIFLYLKRFWRNRISGGYDIVVRGGIRSSATGRPTGKNRPSHHDKGQRGLAKTVKCAL